MKILLDECVPWPIHRLLPSHQCMTAQQCGWGGFRNGELLQKVEREFPLFITADQNLSYQQNLTGYSISILQLSTNNWRRIRAAAGMIRDAVTDIKPSEFRKLDIP